MRSKRNLAAILIYVTFFAVPSSAQHSVSIDLGVIRQKNHHQSGLNISGFYHFSHHWLGGIEVNRFFPVQDYAGEQEMQYAGWDIEMNFHYLVYLHKGIKFYPISGISHTSEKESNATTHRSSYDHFWSVNTGAGMNIELGHWLPHVEYIFTWGHVNQQFILVGIGYEISSGHRKSKVE